MAEWLDHEFLLEFPRPLLVVDDALHVVAHSRRVLSLLGVRQRGDGSAEATTLLEAVLAADADLGDQLALATARLVHRGDEERFSWKRGRRSYAVAVNVLREEPSLLLVLLEDTTASYMSEQILRNARSYLEQVLDDLPLGIVVLSAELRITSVNRRQLAFLGQIGVDLGIVDAIGAELATALPGTLGQDWQALCAQVVASDKRVEAARMSFPITSGELVLATVALPLREQQGQLGGVILICEDVTEETRLERELVKVEKLATVGQMVITINHEINNPLSIISTNAQMLRLLNPGLDEKIRTKLEKIEEQVKRISEVTERLRLMDEVATSEYITSGPEMIDVWNKGE